MVPREFRPTATPLLFVTDIRKFDVVFLERNSSSGMLIVVGAMQRAFARCSHFDCFGTVNARQSESPRPSG
jgi:hypothetical protein